MEEWEQHMSDFVPEDISTIVVEPKKEVVKNLKMTRVNRRSMRILRLIQCI